MRAGSVPPIVSAPIEVSLTDRGERHVSLSAERPLDYAELLVSREERPLDYLGSPPAVLPMPIAPSQSLLPLNQESSATAAKATTPTSSSEALSPGSYETPDAPTREPGVSIASDPASTSELRSYVVHLFSERSEESAQASFKGLQAKFPKQLGGRSLLIQRVNLGNKGMWYRATVGLFASADEAGRFCRDYRAAGGKCIVNKN
jgi:hypothetical protein